MPCNTSNTKQHPMHTPYEFSLATNTTFVKANLSNFRAIVQHLTGPRSLAPATSSQGGGLAQRVVVDADVCVRQTAGIKLHERRQHQGAITNKLEKIKLNDTPYYHGPIDGLYRPIGGHEMAMVSPVSTLDRVEIGVGSPNPNPNPRIDPRSSLSEEKEKVMIAQKGFYLHPIGVSRDYEPQLLPLFPLHSPRNG